MERASQRRVAEVEDGIEQRTGQRYGVAAVPLAKGYFTVGTVDQAGNSAA